MNSSRNAFIAHIPGSILETFLRGIDNTLADFIPELAINLVVGRSSFGNNGSSEYTGYLTHIKRFLLRRIFQSTEGQF